MLLAARSFVTASYFDPTKLNVTLNQYTQELGMWSHGMRRTVTCNVPWLSCSVLGDSLMRQ